MHIRSTPLLALLLAACQPAPPAPAPTPPAKVEAAPETPPVAPAEPVLEKLRKPSLIRTSLAGIPLEAVAFDSRTHHLVVADQPGGPGSQWADSRAAGQGLGGLAAINGGFFTPEGNPLGKVISSGRTAGTENRASSLGAGYFVESKAGTMALIRRQHHTGGSQALQTGPFLVEAGHPVGGLSTKSSTARSLIATDGKAGWLLVRTGACSLSDLARALAGQSLGGVKLQTVLNLDGGRSSDLWVSSSIPSGPLHNRPFWNKPVRNFLVIISSDGGVDELAGSSLW